MAGTLNSNILQLNLPQILLYWLNKKSLIHVVLVTLFEKKKRTVTVETFRIGQGSGNNDDLLFYCRKMN